MTKKKLKVDGAAKSRTRTKEEIKKQFGIKVIGAVMLRLCKVCAFKSTCYLYPITTRGDDCPYFKEETDATNNTDTS
ncbi:hypothetical protein ES708_34515 [subsurface metagenome]